MTLDSLVAILGLAIAAYQIMPRARQLDLSLRFQRFDWFLISLALILIIYLQFFSFFAAIGLSPHLGLSKWNLTPERFSFVVIVVTTTIVGARLHFGKLSVRRLPEYKRLVDELIATQNFSELSALLERHLDRLIKLANDDAPTSRLRRYLIDSQKPTIVSYQIGPTGTEIQIANISPTQGKLHRLVRPLANFLPNRSMAAVSAKEIAQSILTSKEFAFSVARTKPYLATELLRFGHQETAEFLRHYIRALLTEPSTALQNELRDLQTKGEWYVIDVSKPLLHFFFSDAKVAEEYSIWSPVGETVIAELDRLARNAERDVYNLAPDRDFQENEQWQSPLFIAISFFDVMVREALRQGIQWHMWLYYFSHFMKPIIRNCSLDGPFLDLDRTHPTRYSELTYDIFRTMRSWIELVKAVPKDQPNVVMRSTGLDHENGNIPKSTIICLRFCLRDVLPVEKLNVRLKREILHTFFSLYFDLLANGITDYAEALALAMRPGGFVIGDEDTRFRRALTDGFNSFDRIPYPRDEVDDLQRILEIP